MPINKKKKIIILLFLMFIVGALFVFWIFYGSLERLGKLKSLANSLGAYANDNNGQLPDLDHWAQILISQNYCSESIFENEKMNYALNKHLKGLNYYEIPEDMVVFFEAEGAINLIGDYTLIEQTHYLWPGCALQFGYNIDNVKFFDTEQIRKLNWDKLNEP